MYFHQLEYKIVKDNSRMRSQATVSTEEETFSTGVYIPMESILKSVFEAKNMYYEVKDYVDSLNKEQTIFSNFIQGDLWRKKSKSHKEGRFYLPINIFFDDLEVGNGFGTHAGNNKLGAVYMYIPCLPKQYVSQLKSIFLVLLFYSQDRKDYGNKATFLPIITELDKLREDGITITVNNKDYKIYFELGLILGDNLGVNGIFGYNESFIAKSYCRICEDDSETCKKRKVQDD